MGRMRTVKPEFWDDDVVASLSRDARLLFIATWNAADDEGLLRWNAAYLKSTAFIYDDDIGVLEVEKLMAELLSSDLIFRYQGAHPGQQLAVIVRFHRHQKVNRPQASKLPPPSLGNPAVAQMYARRDGWTCHICHEPIVWATQNQAKRLSVDHVQPKSRGGSDYPSNIKVAHIGCNSGKKNRLPEECDESSFGPCSPAAIEGVNGSVSDSLNDHGALTDGMGLGIGEGKGEGGGAGEDNSPARQASPAHTTKSKPRTTVPEDFEITLGLRAWAKSAGINANLTVETQQWLDYHAAKGSRMRDWTASWRTWMRNTKRYGAVLPSAPKFSGGRDW